MSDINSVEISKLIFLPFTFKFSKIPLITVVIVSLLIKESLNGFSLNSFLYSKLTVIAFLFSLIFIYLGEIEIIL